MLELGKVAQMSRPPLVLLPEELDRIEVRRVGVKLEDAESVGMEGVEFLHGRGGVIPHPVVHQDDVTGDDIEQFREEGQVALGVESVLLSLEEELPGDDVNEAKDLESTPLTAGLHDGLLPLRSPGIGQRAPLGETRLVTEEDLRLLGLGQLDDLRPGLALPLMAGYLIEVVGGEASLLIRETQALEQRA